MRRLREYAVGIYDTHACAFEFFRKDFKAGTEASLAGCLSWIILILFWGTVAAAAGVVAYATGAV